MTAPKPIQVMLPADLEMFVREHVNSGEYGSHDEVIGEALRVLSQREKDRDAAKATLRAMIAEGAASADRGELFEIDEVFSEIASLSRARRDAAA